MFIIRPRRRWAASPGNFRHTDWRRRTVDEYVHHTADSGPKHGAKASLRDEIEYLKRIESFHVNVRGYAGIGYSYIVMPSGRVWEGRGFEKVGAHTLDPKDADGDHKYIENTELGVCFAGNFNVQKPTRRALFAHSLLRRRLRIKGVRIDRTYPHRAAYATSCPGDNLVRALNLHP